MFLGNGEQVKYAVTPDNLPHLLGINLDIIRTTYNYSNTSAYDLMIEMLENPYRLHRLFKDNILKIEQVFSKNINEKLEGFKDNFKYDAKEVLEDTDFVCKFESENSWTVTAKKQKYDYIIGPTTTTTAYNLDDPMDDPSKSFMDDVLVIPVNMAGLPGLGIPVGFDKNHMPIGMHIIGNKFEEAEMYRLGSFIEDKLNLDLNPKGGK